MSIMDFVSVKIFFLILCTMSIVVNCQDPIITPSSEFLCLGDSVQLNCSAQGLASWSSIDILGSGQTISFTRSSQTPLVTVGNGTGVLLETDPRIVTSLSFTLTADRIETICTDGQARTTRTISSVQPSPNDDYSVDISGGNFTWSPPSNIDDFLLREYQLTVECNGTVVINESVAETTYRYDAGRLISGPCNAIVAVINSCGDTASNSIGFEVVIIVMGGNSTIIIKTNTMVVDADEDRTGLIIGLSIGLGVSALANIVSVIVVMVVLLHNKNKKNKKKEGSQELTRPTDGDEKTDNQYSL